MRRHRTNYRTYGFLAKYDHFAAGEYPWVYACNGTDPKHTVILNVRYHHSYFIEVCDKHDARLLVAYACKYVAR